jgi:predicted nuclease of predicted toxin-antitoxin system
MTFKLLIDECLSPSLVQMAHAAGHLESTCVCDRSWLGVKDWVLIEKVVDEDFTLVTYNSKDFQGTKGSAPSGL